jgi:hypothetical protein
VRWEMTAVCNLRPPVHESSHFGPSGGEGLKGEEIGRGYRVGREKKWISFA